jgi:hypothetical protein
MPAKNNPPPSYDEVVLTSTNENPPSYYDAVFNGSSDIIEITKRLTDLCKNEMTKSQKRKDSIGFGTMFAMSNKDVTKLEKRSEILFVNHIKITMKKWNVSRIEYLDAHMKQIPNPSTGLIRGTFTLETIQTINDDTTYETLMTILNGLMNANGRTYTN